MRSEIPTLAEPQHCDASTNANETLRSNARPRWKLSALFIIPQSDARAERAKRSVTQM
jgi:hypothetical protein